MSYLFKAAPYLVGRYRIVVFAMGLIWFGSNARGQVSIDDQLQGLRLESNQNGDYLAGYPVANNDPNLVRRNFLALDMQDRPKAGGMPYTSRLTATIGRTLALQSQPMSDIQRDALGDVISQNLGLYIQGLSVAGNIFLLEGLRVNYPNAGGGGQVRPQAPDMPLGCPEAKYPSVPTKASCVAVLFYEEAILGLMDMLSRNLGDSLGLRIKDVSTKEMPPDLAKLPWRDSSPDNSPVHLLRRHRPDAGREAHTCSPNLDRAY